MLFLPGHQQNFHDLLNSRTFQVSGNAVIVRHMYTAVCTVQITVEMSAVYLPELGAAHKHIQRQTTSL